MHFSLSKIITEYGETTNPRKPASKANLTVSGPITGESAGEISLFPAVLEFTASENKQNINTILLYQGTSKKFLLKMDILNLTTDYTQSEILLYNVTGSTT